MNGPSGCVGLFEDAPAVIGQNLFGEGDQTLLEDRRRAPLVLVFEALKLVAEDLTEGGCFRVVVAELLDDFFRGEACHGGLFSACFVGDATAEFVANRLAMAC